MKATLALRQLGQSLWLDCINRHLLRDGTLAHYIQDLSITGVTTNPTLFEQAISAGDSYDASIQAFCAVGLQGEELFFEVALEDVRDAADALRPVYDASHGLEGWVSLEVPPSLAHNTVRTIQAARHLSAQAERPNLMIKIPATHAGISAIEEVIFDGIPVNVTLLFSCEQMLAAAQAYQRGIERRLAAGLAPTIATVLSLFVSRWDVASNGNLPAPLHNQLGIAMAMRTYRAHAAWLAAVPWQRIAKAGGIPPRLLWASTGTKDPQARDTLYVEALAAPGTINTMPEKTLLAFADHGVVGAVLPVDGGYAEAVLESIRREGIDDVALGAQLQREGVAAFERSWQALLATLHEKCALATVSS